MGGGRIIHIAETKCDEKNRQVDLDTITISEQPPIKLVGTETCDSAITGFLDSNCGVGSDRETSATRGVCKKSLNETKVTCTVTCDKTNKYFNIKTRTPSTMPYADSRDCDWTINSWKDGQEQTNPGSCVRGQTVLELV